ncbi:glycosyltransferase family 2 protein [Photobacterium sp. BZF1]|uniref:glycosyltransferase family 2 protein n=1 Tax=Photobacterium sp. BZF1 TaxID=1904457 RepID=UPI00165377EC|nr:glycosyltransferase family 2 protein [Photobacterium sp. BZF1]MBC7006270.1 glycosyltransferase family 2 protein [Photobacterium sp. BZF1]
MEKTIRINVLAYNEEHYIKDCLDSLKAALTNLKDINAQVNVIANGCTDNTFKVAEAYCCSIPSWSAFNLTLGDKANAWNFAINFSSVTDHLTIFIDGDCALDPNSIQSILDTYESSPDSYIIAGIPKTIGRTTDEIASRTIKGEALSGALYALTTNFISKISELNFRLPVGLIGDDSLLAWVATHQFKLSNGSQKGFLIGSKGADFYYHRLTPDSINNIKLYLRRLQRYSLRHLQQKGIREHLNIHDDFETIPHDIRGIHNNIKFSHLRLNSLNGPFDLFNYLKIKLSLQ